MKKCKGFQGMIQVYGYRRFNTGAFIAMEYLPGWVNLLEFLDEQERKSIPEIWAKTIFTQLLYIVIEMSGWIGVIHGDLKCENVLINPETLEVKVCDFGVTYESTNKPIELRYGTPRYYPPEHYRNTEDCYSEPMTVWAIGCILHELVIGKVPFRNKDQILDKNINVSKNISSSLSDLLSCLFDRDQTKRIKLINILTHPWIM